MIVVHTMGRVGSIALHQAIQANHPRETVYHSHLWTNASLDRLHNAGTEARNYALIQAAANDDAVRRRVGEAMDAGEPVAVHWINRDPVARSVSLMHYLRDAMGLDLTINQRSFMAAWEEALTDDPRGLVPWLISAYRWHEPREVPIHPLVKLYRHRQEVMATVTDIPRVNVGRQGWTGLGLPADTLVRIYRDPAVTRDYSPVEIDDFFATWSI